VQISRSAVSEGQVQALIEEEHRMAVRIEKEGPVWTVIHYRPEARNAMDP